MFLFFFLLTYPMLGEVQSLNITRIAINALVNNTVINIEFFCLAYLLHFMIARHLAKLYTTAILCMGREK